MMTHSSQELREAPELWGKSMCRAILRDTRQTNTEPSPAPEVLSSQGKPSGIALGFCSLSLSIQ